MESYRRTNEKGAYRDIQQVDRYLRGCDKKWGILTNGRSWRLMCNGDGETLEHVRFDLVMFLEDLINMNILYIRKRGSIVISYFIIFILVEFRYIITQ